MSCSQLRDGPKGTQGLWTPDFCVAPFAMGTSAAENGALENTHPHGAELLVSSKTSYLWSGKDIPGSQPTRVPICHRGLTLPGGLKLHYLSLSRPFEPDKAGERKPATKKCRLSEKELQIPTPQKQGCMSCKSSSFAGVLETRSPLRSASTCWQEF